MFHALGSESSSLLEGMMPFSLVLRDLAVQPRPAFLAPSCSRRRRRRPRRSRATLSSSSRHCAIFSTGLLLFCSCASFPRFLIQWVSAPCSRNAFPLNTQGRPLFPFLPVVADVAEVLALSGSRVEGAGAGKEEEEEEEEGLQKRRRVKISLRRERCIARESR